jgi:inactivated superfamily I helicase
MESSRNGFVARINKQGHAPQARSRLLEKLQQLAGEFVAEKARAGDVAPGFTKPGTIPS